MRKIMVVTLLAVFLLAMSGLATMINAAQSEYAGETVTIYTSAGWDDVWSELLNKFTQQTGIKVDRLTQPTSYSDFVDKVTTYFATKYDKIDAYFVGIYMQDKFAAAGWLESLNDVPSAEYLADIPTDVDKQVSFYKGNRNFVMQTWNVMMFFYRRDWFLEAGVWPPVTWDQLIDVGKKFTQDTSGDGNIDRYGIALSGFKQTLSNDLTIFMRQAGGSFIDPVSVESRIGIKFYYDMVRGKHKIALPSTFSDDYNESVAAFMADRAAMHINWAGFWPTFASKEGFAKNIGVAFLPRGPRNADALGSGWGWIVPEWSKQKGAIKEFLKFMTTKEAHIMGAEWQGSTARLSLTSHPAFVERVFSSRFEPLYEICMRPQPNIPGYFNMMLDIVEDNLRLYFNGEKSLEEATNTAAEKLRPLIEKAQEIGTKIIW